MRQTIDENGYPVPLFAQKADALNFNVAGGAQLAGPFADGTILEISGNGGFGFLQGDAGVVAGAANSRFIMGGVFNPVVRVDADRPYVSVVGTPIGAAFAAATQVTIVVLG